VFQKYSKQPFGRLLFGIGKTMLHALNEKLIELDIKRNYYALILIEEGQGKLTQQELAVLLESDKVSVVRIVDYLAEKGYVSRVREQSDKRKYGLLLTEKAMNELPQIKCAMEEVFHSAFMGVSVIKLEELYKTLNEIKINLNNRSLKHE
jgi:DNA-binding MarR family transcriptional regulator